MSPARFETVEKAMRFYRKHNAVGADGPCECRGCEEMRPAMELLLGFEAEVRRLREENAHLAELTMQALDIPRLQRVEELARGMARTCYRMLRDNNRRENCIKGGTPRSHWCGACLLLDALESDSAKGER